MIARLAALTAIVFQAAASPVVRLGDVARAIAAHDIAAVEQIAVASVGKPWLLNGPRGQISDLQVIEAYGPPEIRTSNLRRGPMATIQRRGDAAGRTWEPWSLQYTGSYAHVAVPGRDFDRVDGDRDLNRPFRVNGQFTDAELVSLVSFVRSSPAGPAAGKEKVEGAWPVGLVAREPDGIRVSTLRDDLSGQRVTLRSRGQAWEVVEIRFWIV
jgi:hypothetical protein